MTPPAPRRPRLRPLAALVLLAVTAACGGNGDGAEEAADDEPARSTTTAAGSSAEGAPTVRVLEQGAAPRRALRLALREGTTQAMTMRMRMTMSMQIDGQEQPAQSIPPLVMRATAKVGEVADDAAALTVTFDDASFDTTGLDPATAEQLNGSLAAVRGITSSARITDRGQTLEGRVDTSSVTEPNVKQVLDQLSTQFSQLSVPFPEEAVGRGARWVVTQRADLSGVRTTIENTFTLRSLEGDRYELDLAQELRGEEGPAALPGVPAGTTVTIEEYLLSGAGRVTGTLAAIVPSDSTSTIEGDLRMQVVGQGPGESSAIAQHLKMEMALSGA